jgi:hypothetical protein
MKERILKWGVPLFLAAILLVPGVLASAPGTAQAAAKGTTYNVVLQKGSPILSLVSVNGSAAAPELAQQEGISFQMVGGAKAGKDKSGTYYPVTIIAKSYRAPTQKFPMVGGGGMAIQSSYIAKDAVGKLYTSGGAVDVRVVVGPKGAVATVGGTPGGNGAMIFPFTLVSVLTLQSTGKVFMTTSTFQYMTTGQSSLVVRGTKTRLEGKRLPADDTTGSLPNPLVGKPIDLTNGTGTLVSTDGALGNKNKVIGTTDFIGGQIWVMKITPAS